MQISKALVWAIPVGGAIVAALMWGYIFWLMLFAFPEMHKVQFNPANVQDWKKNHHAALALRKHGELSATYHNGKEICFERDGQLCSLYRSLGMSAEP